MKGIILAGGEGTRLYPLTLGMSKQLLPIYDKPTIYYPLSLLMLAGIREILIITTPAALPAFQRLLGRGDQWGLKFDYLEQSEPKGIAEALILGKEFIANGPVCLVLGDNILYGTGLPQRLRRSAQLTDGAQIFAYQVKDPSSYGVVSFESETDESGIATDIQEKPQDPISNYAIPGLYFYDHQASKIAEEITPSERGELEITDVNKHYLNNKSLKVEILGRGIAWLDVGTHDARVQATNYIMAIQERQGMMVSCPEEIAYHRGFINKDQLKKLAEKHRNSYGEYLLNLLKNESRGE